MSEENEYAPGWKPSPGDEVEGKIIAIDARERNRPQPGNTHYPIITVESPDGSQTAVHCFHTVLERELKDNFKASEIVGSHIKIRYEGQREPKGGGDPYHFYRVFGGTRKAAAAMSALNWGDDVPEGPAGSASASTGPVTPSGPATAEPPIPPADLGPLPAQPSRSEQMQQSAEQNFGAEAPF